MTSVTFPPSLGGDGSTVSDDSNPTTGLANGGHRTRFVPALAQTVAMAATAQASAQAATNAPGTYGTSTTSLALGTGSKTLTMQTGRSIVPGMQMVIAYTTTPTSLMRGTVLSYDSGTGQLVVSVDYASTTGTFAAWTISLTGNMPALKTVNGQSILGTGNVTTGLIRQEVSGTTQTTANGYDYWLENVALTAVTVNSSPVDGEEFAVTPCNGLFTNTVNFGSMTVRGPAGSTTGVVTLSMGVRMVFKYSSTLAKWVIL